MQTTRCHLRPVLAVLAVAAAVAAAGCGGGDSTAVEPTAETATPVIPIYTPLARTVDVEGAPGRALALSRVVVKPGSEIPPHHHLGTQISTVEEGALSYTVRKGGVRVMAGSGDKARVVREIHPGETGRVRAGQWLVEQPSTIHQAVNENDVNVVIYIANLLKDTAAPSTPAP